MNGVTRRFLSLREKRPRQRDRTPSRLLPWDLLTNSFAESTSKKRNDLARLRDVFTVEDPKRKPDKEEEKKIKAVLQRLGAVGITTLNDSHAQYALNSQTSNGDVDKAVDLLSLFEASVDGIVREYNPSITALGAENREQVTCYLDALLFAMFARLNSFEAMLFGEFEDTPRKRLAVLLRLWVNMLRSGKLITTDVTKHVQDALASCGWEDAAEIQQQDASEAFTFITDVLELPLLTLKMDIFHQGREDEADDHKFINERLLEVALPEPNSDGSPVTLESCLETYFNNKIEVKRLLQRRATTQRGRSGSMEKAPIVHIDAAEVSTPDTSVASNPIDAAASPLRPGTGRYRQDSIFSERRFRSASPKDPTGNSPSPAGARQRAGSTVKKEVLMPAWQFFSLIPWFTDNTPKSDAQVAAHFSAQRPVLGICLKRYSLEADGNPSKLGTYIDIPLEIGLPHFISDDHMEEEGPLFGNFKLSLQSVVCHRGLSVDSGHYIAFVRGEDASAPKNEADNTPDNARHDVEAGCKWVRFDDLAKQRVVDVEINTALTEESPYLLFYQVKPINEELASRGNPPTYEEANSMPPTAVPSSDNLLVPETYTANPSVEGRSNSLDLAGLDGGRDRSSIASARNSGMAFDELGASLGSHQATAPPTPAEEGLPAALLPSSRRESRSERGVRNRSRPPSQGGESKLSLTMSKLTARLSKDALQQPSQEHGEPEPASQDASLNGLAAGKGVGGLMRSKSKNKKGKKPGHHSTSSRDAPDRECAVM